jgi:hypothetical protein
MFYISYTDVLIAGGILLGAFGAFGPPESKGASTKAEWNGIPIRCSAEEGTVRIDKAPGQCLVQMDFPDDAAHTVVIKSDELRLSSDALGIDGQRIWEVGPCIEITIAGARDRLAVTAVEQHSASGSSEASSGSSNNGASTSARSSSTSTSTSTEVKSLEIATWNGKRIELSLEGGSSVESTINREGEHCRIELNVDAGKNKRAIRWEPPETVTVDGKPLDTDGDYSRIVIEATRRSLTITADGVVIGRWEGDNGRRELRD